MQISVLGEVMVTDEGQELPLSAAEKEAIAELCVRSNRWSRVGAPLSLGRVRVADGSEHTGFLCEAYAAATALDITDYGGWRAYQDSVPHLPKESP